MNEQTDQRVAQYFSLDSWLFWSLVVSQHQVEQWTHLKGGHDIHGASRGGGRGGGSGRVISFHVRHDGNLVGGWISLMTQKNANSQSPSKNAVRLKMGEKKIIIINVIQKSRVRS